MRVFTLIVHMYRMSVQHTHTHTCQSFEFEFARSKQKNASLQGCKYARHTMQSEGA